MDHGHSPPLDDIAIAGLLLMATVAFDCSGARFTEDVDEGEAENLLDLLDGLGDRLFFTAETVDEIERMVRRKIGEARKGLGHDRRFILMAVESISRVRTSFDKSIDLDRLLSEFRSHLKLKDESYDLGLSDTANRLMTIARRRAGPPFDPATLARTHAEARSRYDMDIPPGYCDDRAWCDRNGYIKGQPKGEPDSFGDYVVWKQLMERAAVSGTSVLLVTNDMKEDWWEYDAAGARLAPLATLRKEMQRETGQGFYAITFDEFRRLAPKALVPMRPIELVTPISKFRRELNGGLIPAWMLNAKPLVPIGLHRLLADRNFVSKIANGMSSDLTGLARSTSRSLANLGIFENISYLNRQVGLGSMLPRTSKKLSFMNALRERDGANDPNFLRAIQGLGTPMGLLPKRLSIIDAIKNGALLSQYARLTTAESAGSLPPEVQQRLLMKQFGIVPRINDLGVSNLPPALSRNERHVRQLTLGEGGD